MTYTLHHGDCLDIMPTIPDVSVDAIICDPPYPMIRRDYGMMTETAWMEMMQAVVRQSRRILKPNGSAVFILQPNSEKVGKIRLWLWEFMVWAGKEWNIVQDAYWWNNTAQPTVHTILRHGLMRPSVKYCVWIGNDNCYRHQLSVLNPLSESALNDRRITDDRLIYRPSTSHNRAGRMVRTCIERGGSTPFNLQMMSNSASNGHGAGTPLKLADWWTRYICPPGGTVCDPFMGSGTMGIVALNNGCNFVGCEKMQKHYDTAQARLTGAVAKLALMEAIP